MRRVTRLFVALAAVILCAAPAFAQYKPQALNDPATGEKFHIEATAAYWFPTADFVVSSGGSGALSGIGGSQISGQQDLGFTDKRLPQLGLVLRPARSHKLRMQYIPIRYDATAALKRTLVFNGQAYSINLPVTSTLDWKAYRFNYEFDFIVRNRGFVGFITEVKYTDVQVQLNTSAGSTTISEFARARYPIPALGAVARVYVVPNISITGEFTGFKIPDSIDSRYNAHYVDLDIYGTMNFSNNVGVQAGYRSLDLGYLIKEDAGSFTLKGLYVGAVLRY